MKIKIEKIFLLFSFFTLLFVSNVFAITNSEIDAYYDAKQKDLRGKTYAKNKQVEEKLKTDLNKIDSDYKNKVWEMYKKVYGDDFEKVKPFLPESNPNPIYHAENLLKLPRNTALNALQNIRSVNPDLAEKVSVIYEEKYSNSNLATTTKITEEEVLNIWKPYVVRVTCVSLNPDDSKKSYSDGTGLLGNYKKGIGVLSNTYIKYVNDSLADYCEITLPTSREVLKIERDSWYMASKQERIGFFIKELSEHLKWLVGLPNYQKIQKNCKPKQIQKDTEIIILGYPKNSDKTQVSGIKGKVLETSSSTSDYLISDTVLQDGLGGGVVISPKDNCYVGIATFRKKDDPTKTLILDVNKMK